MITAFTQSDRLGEQIGIAKGETIPKDTLHAHTGLCTLLH